MRFCINCGSPLAAAADKPAKIPCQSCGGETPFGFKFCQHCGTPLPQDSGAGPEGGNGGGARRVRPATRDRAAAPPPAEQVAAPEASVVPRTINSATPVPQPAAPQPAAPQPAAPQPAASQPAAPQPAASQPAAPQPAAPQPAAPQPAAPTPVPSAPVAGLTGPPVGAQAESPALAPASKTESRAPGSLAAAALAASVSAETVGPGTRGGAVQPARQVFARLVSVRRDGTDGDAHEFLEEAVDMGRTAGQLTFPDDPYLEDRHCRFSLQDGAWVVQDLDSLNGVFVRTVDTYEMQDGDRFLLGKQMFRYEWIDEAERNPAPAVENGVMVLGSPLRPPWGRLRQITVAGVARDVYHLYRSAIIIGREEGDILFPDDEFMSRQHLLLSQSAGKVQLEDLESSNGTFVRVTWRRNLAPNTMLRVGDQLLRFELP